MLFHISLALEQSLRVWNTVLEKEPQIAQVSFAVIFLFSLAQLVNSASLITSHIKDFTLCGILIFQIFLNNLFLLGISLSTHDS